LYLPRTLSRAISQDEREHSGISSPSRLPHLGIHFISSPSSPRSIYTPHMGPPTAPSPAAPPSAPVFIAATAPAAVGSTSVQRPGALRQLGRVGRAVARSLGAGGATSGGGGGAAGAGSGSTGTPRLLPSSSTLGFMSSQQHGAAAAGHPSRSAGASSSNISDALGASARLGIAGANAADAAAAAAAGNSPPRSGEPYYVRSIQFPE
jgi:hypothetical protein